MKLSKSTTYAINWLYSNSKSIEDIADELNLQIDTVREYVEKHHVSQSIPLANKSEPVKSSKDLMIRHTRDKQTNNVSIMTREASAYNDEAKKKFTENNRNKDHIFNPNK
jgi:orotate phosphoribosyltransferase-like protein